MIFPIIAMVKSVSGAQSPQMEIQSLESAAISCGSVTHEGKEKKNPINRINPQEFPPNSLPTQTNAFLKLD